MIKLLRFEFKKQFSSTKNRVVWLLLLVTLLIFAGYNMTRDLSSNAQNTAYDSTSWNANLQLNLLLQTYPKNPPEDAKKAMDLWRADATYAAQQRVFSRWVGADRWRDVVLANINRNENVLAGLREGYISGQSKTEGGVSEADLENNIALNTIFYDQDIKPLRTPYQMTGTNFLMRVLSDLMPYLAAVVVLLICSDSFTSEMDTGSFKFLLIQPYSRNRILAAKLISNLVTAIATVFITLAITFGIVSLFNGVGSFHYPIAFDPHAFSSFAVTEQSDLLKYLGAGEFLSYATLLLTTYILFLTSFASLASILSQESLNAMTVTISLVFAAAVLQSAVARIPGLRLFWPFTYNNVIQVMSGGSFGSTLAGILVYTGFSTALTVTCCHVFNKKDILC